MGNYKLPDNFFFGAAMSGPQTEGAWQDYGKLPNLWDVWSNERITDFYNLVGSYAGNDFADREHLRPYRRLWLHPYAPARHIPVLEEQGLQGGC